MEPQAEPRASVFFQITKVDAEKREVSGIATSETRDKDGETLDYERSKPYFKAWSDEARKTTADPATPGRLSLGNVREMHGDSAVGKLTELDFDDPGKTIRCTARVVDDAAWRKCAEGVYRGFSIGGRYVGGRPGPGQKYVANPVEISLVDNPCNPDATFAYVKSGGAVEMRKFAKADTDATISAEQRRELLQAALCDKYPPAPNPFSGVPELAGFWIQAVYDGFAIVCCQGKTYRIPYMMDGTAVALGEPEEVVADYAPADKSAHPLWVAKDHEDFHVRPDPKIAEPNPELAGAGPALNCITDTKPALAQGEIRASDPFDSEAEGWIQDVGKGVSGDECPCADCSTWNLMARFSPEKFSEVVKSDQDYATHNGEKVPRSKHAYAPPGTSPSEWKYPIDKPSRVRNALARWGQDKGIPDADKPKVARRIIAAAHKFGIKVSPDDPIVEDAKKSATAQKSGCARLSPPMDAPHDTAAAIKGEQMPLTLEDLSKRLDDIEKGKKKDLETIGSAMDKLAKSADSFNGELHDAHKVIKGVVAGATQGESFSPQAVDPQAAIRNEEHPGDAQLSSNDQQWKAALAEMEKRHQDQMNKLVGAMVGRGADGAAAAGVGDRSDLRRGGTAATVPLGKISGSAFGVPRGESIQKRATDYAELGAQDLQKQTRAMKAGDLDPDGETALKLAIMRKCPAYGIEEIPPHLRDVVFRSGRPAASGVSRRR